MPLKQPKKWFRRLIWAVIGLFLAYIAMCWMTASQIISPPRRLSEKPADLENYEVSPQTLAWASPSVIKKEAKNIFVFSHGLLADQSFFVGTALELQKRGHGVVLLPMPGHGSSPEPKVGFGITESELIRKTVDGLPEAKIILVGCSMGGAATWLASDHPKVSAVATEGAYGRLEPVTRHWFERKNKGGAIFFRPVIWIASWRLGKNPSEINPVLTAKLFKKPALVIHCEKDSLIPREQSLELAQAASAEYWEIAGAKHAQGQEFGKEYVDRLENLCNSATLK